MTAEIIKFPSRDKDTETTITVSVTDDYQPDDIGLITMSLDGEIGYIRGFAVKKPKSRQECLKLCKDFLSPEDYQDIMCGIMDTDHYDALEAPYRKIIDAYFSFKS